MSAHTPPGALSAALTREHHEIDAGIKAVVTQLSSSNPVDLSPLLGAIAALRRHIYLEEEFAFPALPGGVSMMAVQVMLREHGEIWRTMDAVVTTINDPAAQPGQVSAQCRTMLDLLD